MHRVHFRTKCALLHRYLRGRANAHSFVLQNQRPSMQQALARASVSAGGKYQSNSSSLSPRPFAIMSRFILNEQEESYRSSKRVRVKNRPQDYGEKISPGWRTLIWTHFYVWARTQAVSHRRAERRLRQSRSAGTSEHLGRDTELGQSSATF